MRLAGLIALTVCAHTAFNGSRVTVSLFALDQGATALTVGAIVSLYSLLPMFLSVAAGRMIDRVGTAVPLRIASLTLTAGVLLPALLPGLVSLHVAATAIGLAYMVFHIGVQNAVGAMSPPASGR